MNKFDSKEITSTTKFVEKKKAPCVERLERIASGNAEDDEFAISSFREEGLQEKCGVFGCISNGDWPTSLDVAHIICLGLVGLQHRGQESAGIVTCKYKSEPFKVSRSEGLVSQAFSEISMKSLKGNLGIGHTRYSTTGGSSMSPLTQPFVVYTEYGTIAVAHNGELANSSKLRETLLSRGVGLTTGVDSELITQCLSQSPPDELKHPRFRARRLSNTPQGSQTSNANGNQKNGQTKQYSVGNNSNSNNNNNNNNSNNSNDTQQPNQFRARANSASDSTNGSPLNTSGVMPIWKADLTTDEDNITSRLLHLMSLTPISYSLIVMYNECLYATRDSFGNRPLTIGMLMPPPNAGDMGSVPFSIVDNCFVEGWVVSSESCPFPSIHAKLKRDVQPGEIIKFERNKLPKTLAFMPRPGFAESPAFCIFEYVYFARPDSIMETQAVYSVRKKCGQQLARESAPAALKNCQPSVRENYIVSPVPESSIPAALGFAQETGLPYVEVFCKNRYVGRTFIQPSTRLRRLGVAKKFGPLTENFVGKNIILIDDSIVRGTTIGQLVRLLREAGANQVHIRIASPPLHFPCYMGINIPTREELIANHLNPEQLALSLGAASLKYLSVKGLKESVQAGIRENMIASKKGLQMPQVGDSTSQQAAALLPQFANATLASDSIELMKTIDENIAELESDGSAVKAAIQSAATASVTAAAADDDDDENNKFSIAKPDLESSNKRKQQQQQQQQPQQALSVELDEGEWRRKVGHCDACLTGRYPVRLDEESF